MPPDSTPLIDRLDACMAADRAHVRRRLRQIERGRPGKRGQRAPTIDELAGRVERSIALRAERAAAVPKVRYPADLPVAQQAEKIADAIAANQVIVVCGETGSGKTTQLPKICLAAGRGVEGMIGHTQPRRLAARSVGARIAEELGTTLGDLVGAKVRFGDQTSRRSLVKLMTDGILLAETRGDPLLYQYDTIIIDEAHERSLNIDFLLGYLSQILPKRPDLKVIITSATIDPQRFADHFEKQLHAPCPVIMVEGRSYPVEVRYRPPTQAAEGADPRSAADTDLPSAVLAALDEIGAEHPASGGGDVLVFMPGEREIRETAKALRGRYDHAHGIEILPLYARLSYEDQRRVFAPHRGRRIVIATNVAETSITVPGVRYVIDPGYARISRYSARNKIQGLAIEPISKASADQRKGRCGRVAPGICIRLFSEADFDAREPFTPPEIMRTNLAGVVLQMASLRLGRPERFPFVEAPETRYIRDGYDTLRELGAVDDDAGLTRIGEEMARLPIDPRIARMLVAAHDEHCLSEALIIATGLAIQDPRERPVEKADAADQMHELFRDPSSDFLSLAKLWHFYHDHIRPLSRSKRTKACLQNFLSDRRLREWQELQAQIRALLSDMNYRFNGTPASPDAVHRALLTGLVTSIGRKKNAVDYEGPRGVTFNIHPGSALFEGRPKWVMAAELVRTTRLYARTLARIDPAWIEPIAGDLCKRSYNEPHFDPRSGRVLAKERVTLVGVEIVAGRRVDYGGIDPVHARSLFIQHGLVDGGYESAAPCLVHNRQLEKDLSELEHKARRRDLLAETEARYHFYDERIPETVHSGQSFERWIRHATRRDVRTLYMEPSDILVVAIDEIGVDAYPDALSLGKTDLPLNYAFDPGTQLDGVAVEVPVGVLGQLSQDQADRLVPGLLVEKIESLIRTLPKALRRQFDITPLARRLAPELARSQGSLLARLSERLSQLTGVRITAEMFKPDEVDAHLRLYIRVVGEDGSVLAEGRNLTMIKAELGDHINRGFNEVASTESRWHADGLTDWTFGDLPGRIDIDAPTLTVHAYPAIVDQGDAVGLRLVDSAEAAKRMTRRGLMRLMQASLKRELKLTPDAIEGFGELAALHATLGTSVHLRDELMLLLAERVFIGDHKPPRSPEAFEEALDRGWNRLASTVDEVVPTVRQVLGRRQEILSILEGGLPQDWLPAAADIREQLGLLFPERYMTETPYRWLRCVPRYLRAMRVRIDRLRGNGVAKDRVAMLEARKWQTLWVDRRARHDLEGVTDPEIDEMRWLVEEYRVSLFAQELRTIVAVSPTRLARQWEKVRP